LSFAHCASEWGGAQSPDGSSVLSRARATRRRRSRIFTDAAAFFLRRRSAPGRARAGTVFPRSSRARGMTRPASLATLALLLCACDPDPGPGDERRAETSLEIDISENMSRFSFDEAPVFDDGMPAFGNDFITQG